MSQAIRVAGAGFALGALLFPAGTAVAASEAGSSHVVVTVPAVTQMKAEEIAAGIAKRIPTAFKVTRMTQANDPNRLLGRPGGYTSGAWIWDSRGDGNDLGVDVGAVVEVFKSASVAQGRVDYVTAISEGLGFGHDYITRIDNVVLRVTSELTPAQFRQYKRAFAAVMR